MCRVEKMQNFGKNVISFLGRVGGFEIVEGVEGVLYGGGVSGVNN